MAQEVIEVTEREVEIIEVIERGPVGPTGPQPNINYEVVSNARTLEAADLIAADTSGGAFTLTLPANPNNGDAVDIFDYAETFDTNPLTIARNGQPIESLNEDLVANVEGAYFTLIYTGATRGWQVLPRYGTSGGGGESALTTQGDMLYRGAAVNTRLGIGTAGQILKVNSSATAPEWGAAPATGVTSVSGTAPIASSGGVTPTISISPATTSAAGSMSSADKTKLDGIAANANNYTHPNHSGEVTSSGDGATTIANDAVTNAKLANVATATIKGRATAGTGDPEDLTASQVRTILNVADGAEVNVQSNWTEADSGSDAFILNKPSIPTASSTTPSALGVAAAGSSNDFARADHVHAMPTAVDIGAAPATGIDPTAITGTAVVDSDARLSDSRTPSSHASSHAVGGSDPLAPSDIGAQSLFDAVNVTEGTETSPHQLSALRAQRVRVATTNDFTIRLPESGHQSGDIVEIFAATLTATKTITIERGVGSTAWATLATITTQNAKIRILANGTGRSNWQEDSYFTTNGTLGAPAVHVHAAADITSGTLAHERGGLEADVSAYNGLLKIASGSTSAVTVTAAGEALLDDADAAAQRTTLGLGNSATLDTGTTAGTVAEGNHTHTQLHDKSHSMTDATSHTAGNHKVFYSDGSGNVQELALGNSGEVLTSNGATSAPSFAAASGGDTVSIDASAADVLTATSGAISADDGGTIDSSDPFIKWDDTAGKLVYANPLSRPSGAFYVGLAPTTTALGANAINIQSTRNGATNVASGSSSICIGTGGNTASGQESISIGVGNAVSALRATAVGYANTASGQESVSLGSLGFASGVKSVGVNETAVLRGQVSLLPFRAVYWGGQTTDATATVLNLDATATNRFTIASNSALAVDILLVARRSDTADKWLVARRFLGIRRDGSNNTSLIGSVQTLGTDQSEGSPSWTFALTADDTNEALQLEVTGAASETVQWRATAFYRFV